MENQAGIAQELGSASRSPLSISHHWYEQVH
jgi:hypothetical protein